MDSGNLPVTCRSLNIFGDRQAFILDNVVSPDASIAIYDLYKNLPYELSDSDRPDTNHIKHLKHEFALNDPKALCLAEPVREFLKSNDLTHGDIYRIYSNFNLHGDFQFAHEDGPGWTALYFVNSEGEEDWGGEFTLYFDDELDLGYTVLPKPGRLVIFDGMIVHRGGVPSKLCYEPRISLAIKFAP